MSATPAAGPRPSDQWRRLGSALVRPSGWERPVLVVGGIAALAIRLALLDHITVDYLAFTGRWYEFLEVNGGFAGLDELDADYTAPYLYLLAFASMALDSFSGVVAIKLMALPFDFVLAGFVYLLVRHRYPEGWPAPLAALAALFAPTVVLNGAFWGQSDAIYTSGVVATVYLLVTERPRWAMVAFGLAISFKLQAIFLAPLLLALLLTRQLRWWHPLIVPIPYAVLALPALALGRAPRETLFAYVDQAGVYEVLSKNAPNLYQWVPNGWYDAAYPLGILGTAAAMLLLVLAIVRGRRPLSANDIVLVATASLVLVPFLLPKMHDRYFFPADVMAIVLAAYFPRLIWVPVVVIGASLAAYIPFISISTLRAFRESNGIGSEPIPLPLAAAFMSLVAVVLAVQVLRAHRAPAARPAAR